MRSLTFLVFILLLPCSISCRKSDETALITARIDTNNFHKYTLGYKDSIRVFQLETNKDCLLHDITSINLSDSLVIVFDARGKSVSLFDMNGHFIRKIEKQGNGPGEFIQLTNMHYNPREKLIEIFDNPQKKLFVYELRGNLVETKRSVINFISFAKSPEGYYVYSPFVDHNESAGYNPFLLSDHIKGRFLPTQNNFDRALFTSSNPFIALCYE